MKSVKTNVNLNNDFVQPVFFTLPAGLRNTDSTPEDARRWADQPWTMDPGEKEARQRPPDMKATGAP